MEEDQSFGIVPIRWKKDKVEYLLIQHQVGHWGFPKGHKNPGEKDVDTAQREFMEETGLELKKIYREKFFEEDYTFSRDDVKTHKVVKYFVGLVKEGELKVQEAEIKNAAWLSFRAASKQLVFPEAKRILKSINTEIIPKLQKADKS